MAYGILIALVLSIAIAWLLFHFLKAILPLILNGLFGVFVFWILSAFGLIHVPIDIWTFLVAAIGGVLGVTIVIILVALGVPI